MRTGEVLRSRFGAYGALWLASFILVAGGAAIASLGLGYDLVDIADIVLPPSFMILGLASLTGVGFTAVSRASLVAKCLVAVLALLLILPLLWSPVLAIVVVAAISQVAIEYSTAYAQFRIGVSQLIYPVVAMLVDGPLVAAVWNAFQVVASIVGFAASALQVWRVIKPWLSRPAAEA